MKKSILLLTIICLALPIFSQTKSKTKAKVLCFKANLSCYLAKYCNTLDSEFQQMVIKNYPQGKIISKEIFLSGENNKPIVEKYKTVSHAFLVV